MVQVRIVSAMDYFDEGLALLQANWSETGLNFPMRTEDMRAFYAHLEKYGAVKAVGAWAGKELVGYCVAAILPHPWNTSIRFCNAEGFYLKREHRNGTLAARMMSKLEEYARGAGANFLQWHAPHDSPFARALSRRYKPTNLYFKQELNHGC